MASKVRSSDDQSSDAKMAEEKAIGRKYPISIPKSNSPCVYGQGWTATARSPPKCYMGKSKKEILEVDSTEKRTALGQ